MAVQNAEIAALLNQIGDLLEIEGANPFRIRAYHNAARTVEGLPQSVTSLLEAGQDLAQLPGIGQDLAGKISQIARTGRLPLLEQLKRRIPPELAALRGIASLGPKRLHLLHEELGIASRRELLAAAKAGKIRLLRGFSAQMEQRIVEALAKREEASLRFKRSDSEAIARSLIDWIRGLPDIDEAVVAGSYRRKKDTVGDLDILVTCRRGTPVIEHFVRHEDVVEILAQGTTRSTVLLRNGLQVDLRVVRPISFGAALHYFTGSKAHNLEVRRMGQAKGLKINEYGVFDGERRIGGRTEQEIYRSVGLPYIEPELREASGEIEAAVAGRLPKLLSLSDIRGDLHVHSSASDGLHSVRELAETARARGYAYLAISDHSKRVAVAHGLDESRLARQIEEIDRLQERLTGIRILKSIEVDILEDGTLDLPAHILRRLDFVIGAIHSGFHLPRQRQTERILRAMDGRLMSILAHPTGRLINQRPPYEVDMDRVIRGAREHGCVLELNAHPDRLDLDDVHCRAAREAGVGIAISTDTHRLGELGFMRFGVDQARRGWLEPSDVVNTLACDDLLRRLRR